MATSIIELETPDVKLQPNVLAADHSKQREEDGDRGDLPAGGRAAMVAGVPPEAGIQFLRVSPVFAGLSKLECCEIESHAEELSYSQGQTIFLQGDPVHHVYVVASGMVKVTQVSEEGKETLLRLESCGNLVDDVIGTSQFHSLTARAMDSCCLLAWETSVFESFSHRHNAIHRNTAAIMRARLRILEDRFCDVATRRVPQRLARLVLQLAGEKTQGSLNPIALSREELAQMAGTSLFTVSRLLSSWAESSILTVDRKEVVIEDLPRLLQLAEAA